MNYYCLNENEFGVVCGRKIEGTYAEWFAKNIMCVCQECAEAIQTQDENEYMSRMVENR